MMILHIKTNSHHLYSIFYRKSSKVLIAVNYSAHDCHLVIFSPYNFASESDDKNKDGHLNDHYRCQRLMCLIDSYRGHMLVSPSHHQFSESGNKTVQAISSYLSLLAMGRCSRSHSLALCLPYVMEGRAQERMQQWLRLTKEGGLSSLKLL